MSASVTICLCTCDGASHLAQQLASLASQTRLPDEVVISDDGSKDGTLDLLERWAASVATSVLIERRADPVGHVANLEGALRRALRHRLHLRPGRPVESREGAAHGSRS